MDEAKDKKCKGCKCYRFPSDFLKQGRVLKNCQKCRGRYKCPCGVRKYGCTIHGGSSRCECGKQKSNCLIHGGSAICECGKQRGNCLIHGTTSICECGKQKSNCKIHSDPMKVTIRRWVSSHRIHDRKYNRYDADHHIDECFLHGLVEESPNCYHCDSILQYVVKQPDMATIERLNNDIGHIKSNCVIACYKCNLACVGGKKSHHPK